MFCESPGSLTFEVQDIPAIAEAAHAQGRRVLMDNTWATPLFFQPMAHGVDLSIQAATKYLGGHADVMMGTSRANESHAARLHETHGDMGLFASGDDCFLALRGLRTLAVRLKRHQETALKLARWLRGPAGSAAHPLSRPARRSRPCPVEARFQGRLRPVRVRTEAGFRGAVAAFVDGLQPFRHRLFLGRV